MKTELTRSEYLQLLGIVTMAKTHYAKGNEFYKAAQDMVQVADNGGHIYDMCSEYRDFDEGLKLMGITVKEPT